MVAPNPIFLGIGRVFKFIFQKWRILPLGITFLVIILSLSQAVVQSIKEGDIKIILTKVSEQIFFADKTILDASTSIIYEGSTFFNYLKIFAGFMILKYLYKIMHWLLEKFGFVEVGAILISLVLLILLNEIYMVLTTGQLDIPFPGARYFIININEIILQPTLNLLDKISFIDVDNSLVEQPMPKIS